MYAGSVLGPLSLSEATELLTGIGGPRTARDEESALNQLAGLCEGMPLALRIIGNRLVSRPGWDAAELAVRLADEEHRLAQFKAGDLKIATAFCVSYEQLADAARRVFRRLAVVPGAEFDAALAAVPARWRWRSPGMLLTSWSTSACCMTALRDGTDSTTLSVCSLARGSRKRNRRPSGGADGEGESLWRPQASPVPRPIYFCVLFCVVPPISR